MRSRIFDQDLLKNGMRLRKRLLAVVQNFEFSNAEQVSEELFNIEASYRTMTLEMQGLRELAAVERMADALQIAAFLCKWIGRRLEATPDAQHFFTAAKDRTLLLQESLKTLEDFPSTYQALEKWVRDAQKNIDVLSFGSLIHALGCIPLPIFYAKHHDPRQEFRNNFGLGVNDDNPSPQKPITPPVIKLLFSLNGLLWTTPQAIQSDVQYDLQVDVTVSQWPSDFPILEIDYISTMDRSAYSATPFVLSEKESIEQTQLKGHLIFKTPQSLLSEPATLKVRGRFVSEGHSKTLSTVILGHHELCVRALGRESYPILTTYPMMDIQIPKVFQEAQQALPDLNPEVLNDFLRCLIRLAQYAGMVGDCGVFKGKKINEPRDFQKHLLQALRMTDLGSEVKEGERITGGFLDLRYRNIVIELKVSRTEKEREKIRKEYIEQPSQYAMTSIPISIACILDMTEKIRPPSNIANNITLETPTLHGFEEAEPPYPSKVAVLIIDGNLKSPSDYSN